MSLLDRLFQCSHADAMSMPGIAISMTQIAGSMLRQLTVFPHWYALPRESRGGGGNARHRPPVLAC